MSATAENLPAGYQAEGGLRVKYELAFNPAEQTATIIRSLYAGISGPHGEAEAITTREQAEAFAFAAGLIPAAQWSTTAYGEHYVLLTSFKG